MKLFNKVAIVGVGLIGGSVALAARKRKIAGEVVGIFRRRSTLRRALACRAIDRGFLDVADGVKGADLIIFASPVRSIPALVSQAIGHMKAGAIITDVGSTKAWIVSEAERRLRRCPEVRFVGSHPMAGSEKTGVEFSRSDLFEGSPCIVTKTSGTDDAALRKVAAFWKALGAKVDVMTPAGHDRAVSLISHLPHVVAFGLAGAVPQRDLEFAAEGFKDTTRVASSDPELWADIFLTNRREVVKAARLFERYFRDIVRAVSKDDARGVARLLRRAKTKRDRFYGNKA